MTQKNNNSTEKASKVNNKPAASEEKKNAIEKAFELTAKKEDFSEWYSQVLLSAQIVDNRYDLKGMAVWMPYGYSIMNNIKKYWDNLFQSEGIKEFYFPQIVPIRYCEMNPEWWNGFKQEGYRVIAGEKDELQGALRPTGEAAMYPMYSMWIRSHNDLPFKGYETVSSFRYETKDTRPLIRTREITVWHEIHTVHATKEDATAESLKHIEYYNQIWDVLAAPRLIVDKPAWECFPGAVGSQEFYNIMPNGKVLENGSINNLGQAYAKKFNIKFKDKDEQEKYGWMVCTGNGARLLVAMIASHGDDKGLIIPPQIAPIKVSVIPIIFKKDREMIIEKAKELTNTIKNSGIAVDLDERDIAAGSKFYDWEIKGIPIRVELGPKDIENNKAVIVLRDSGEKIFVSQTELCSRLKLELDNMQKRMFEKAKKLQESKITYTDTFNKITSIMDKNVVKIHWCQGGECYDKVKAIKEGFEIFGTDHYERKKGKCVVCGKETDRLAYVANPY